MPDFTSLENIIKFIIPIIASICTILFTAYKLFNYVSSSKETRVRDKYKFTKEFLDDMQKPLGKYKNYLIEIGFSAITGKGGMDYNEILFCLSQPNPSLSIRRYFAARTNYVEYSESECRAKFSERFISPRKRKIYKAFYAGGYFILALTMFLPLILTIFLSKEEAHRWMIHIIFIIPLFFITFGTTAILFLLEYRCLIMAEKIVYEQKTIETNA